MARKQDFEKVKPTTLRDSSFTFALEKSYVSLDDFEKFVHEIRATLRNVTKATAGSSGNWVLTDLRYGSAVLSFAPSPNLNGKRELMTSAVIEGFQAVELASGKPSYFSDRALKALRRLSVLSEDGAMTVRAPDGRRATLTATAEKNLDILLRPTRRYFGSVVGSLDILSVHTEPYVTIYGDLGDVARCYISAAHVDEAKDILGRRVIVSGLIRTNRLGNVVSIQAEELFEAPRRNNASPSKSAGAIPDFTGGLSTADYLTSIRRDAV